MDTDRIRLFVEIIEQGTLSAAARTMHITQPAASRNLKLLEEELGAALLARQGRGLVLTQTGRALVPIARAMLSNLGALEQRARVIAKRELFDVRIGTVDSVATYLMPHIIEPMRASFPDLAIKFYTSRTVELLSRLEAGTLDIALVAWSGAPDEYPEADRLGPYDLQFYGDRTVFGALERISTEEELQQFPIVQIESKPGQPTLIDEDAPSFAVAGSLATVKALVLGGFGVGAMLGFMLTAKESSRLVKASIPHDPDCALWALTSHSWRDQPHSPAIRARLVEALQSCFPVNSGATTPEASR
jgi:DNA-binding transcriptional LysR family regulator